MSFKNPFKKKKNKKGNRTIGQIVGDAQNRALDQMYPMDAAAKAAGGIGSALDLNNPTPTPNAPRSGPGYGGMAGMGMRQSQGTGEVQVAQISPTTGWRYNVGE